MEGGDHGTVVMCHDIRRGNGCYMQDHKHLQSRQGSVTIKHNLSPQVTKILKIHCFQEKEMNGKKTNCYQEFPSKKNKEKKLFKLLSKLSFLRQLSRI